MSFPVELRRKISSYSAELVHFQNHFPEFPSSAKTDIGKLTEFQTVKKRSSEPFHQQFYKEKDWHALPFQV
jgi:hypothetical protein